MNKINWKLFNLALWLEILLAYLLPFKQVAEGRRQLGFPFAFLSVYDASAAINPMMATHFNPLAFLLNATLIYLVLTFTVTAFRQLKQQSTPI